MENNEIGIIPDSYLEFVKSVECSYDEGMQERLANFDKRLMHGILGLATEGNEFVDNLKAHIMYGKDFDYTNLIEELGDSFFFFCLILISRGLTLNDIITSNQRKLLARYSKGKFDKIEAINRNKNLEMQAIENE